MSEFVTSGPIDRTPGIPGSDKNIPQNIGTGEQTFNFYHFLTNRIKFSEKNTQIISRFFCRCNANLISILKALYLPILHTVTMSHIGGSCWLIGGYRWSSVVIFDEFDCFLVWDDLAPGKFGIGQYGNRTIWHQDNLAPGQFGTIM